MIRKSTVSLKNVNKNKINTLDSVVQEYKRVVNLFIDIVWKKKDFASRYMSDKVDTWLSARLQQSAGKTALENVKSQRKRKKKTKPVYTKNTMELDSRFVEIREDENSFDLWFKLGSIGNKIKLLLPSKKHKHLNTLLDKGFNLKSSCKVIKRKDCYEIDVYLEKEEPKAVTNGNDLGMDCGYKKLISTSSGNHYGVELEEVYEKISRKKQGSKAFKRALTERDNLIGKSLNQMIEKESPKRVVCEDLKNVKKDTRKKKRLTKKFTNKFQRWCYSKTLSKLSDKCEEYGIGFTKVSPAYTSQTCSSCGTIEKTNRKGEVYSCSTCSVELDADTNAAVNILHRGAYSPSDAKAGQ
jgi:putative transposase